MSNTLKRSGYFRTTAPIPYVPFRPAYTYSEPIYGYFINDKGYAWDAAAMAIRGPNSATSALNNADNNQTLGIIGYRVVNVPAQAAQQGVPGQTIAVPAPGWTAFARSFRSIAATGKGSFQVPVGVSGVVVGLAEYALPSGGYSHIKHGLLFAGDHVYEAQSGSDFGTYTQAEVFAVSTDGKVVSYLRDGAVMGAVPSTYRAGESLYLTAVLSNIGDEVDSPALEFVNLGGSEQSLPAMTVRASENDYADVAATIPAATVSAGVGEHVAGILPALAGLSGSNDVYGAVIAALPEVEGTAFQGSPPLTQPVAENEVQGVVVTALGLTGEIGGVEASLPSMGRLISEGVYGEAITTLPVPLGYAYTEPEGQAFTFEDLSAIHTAAAATTVLAVVLDGVTLGCSVVTTSLLDAAVQELISAAPSVATQQLLDAIARTFIRAGGTGTLESTAGRVDLDTWVWHVDAGGSTSYSGYPFNSFAVIGGKQYGASADGIFLLEGDDDAGTAIDASIDLGKLDFGNAQLKTVSQCYLGVSAKGNLFLKLISEGKEFIYRTRSFSEEMQQQRITTGKGPRTNYITAQFFNEDGADFEIDTVAFLVADLSRRIP